LPTCDRHVILNSDLVAKAQAQFGNLRIAFNGPPTVGPSKKPRLANSPTASPTRGSPGRALYQGQSSPVKPGTQPEGAGTPRSVRDESSLSQMEEEQEDMRVDYRPESEGEVDVMEEEVDKRAEVSGILASPWMTVS
jgi:hypothetical protein